MKNRPIAIRAGDHGPYLLQEAVTQLGTACLIRENRIEPGFCSVKADFRGNPDDPSFANPVHNLRPFQYSQSLQPDEQRYCPRF
jgi:hypothetical protein